MEQIDVTDIHTCGEPARIIMDDSIILSGRNMLEKWSDAKIKLDMYRRRMLYEPHGHRDAFGTFVFLKKSIDHPCNEIEVIFCDSGGFLTMCGHGSICLGYFLAKTNKIKKSFPETKICLSTPAGKVNLFISTPDAEKVEDIILEGIKSFVYSQDNVIFVNKTFGKIKYDIAYGGNFFAFVDLKQINLKIEKKNISFLLELGKKLLTKINLAENVYHPIFPEIKDVRLIAFTEDATEESNARNFIVWEKQFDRSPCGSGTSARLALLKNKGMLEIGEKKIFESITNGCFEGWLENEEILNGIKFYTPKIKSRAFLSGKTTLIFEEDDPLKDGFFLF